MSTTWSRCKKRVGQWLLISVAGALWSVAHAYTSEDRTLESRGFIENATHTRDGPGLTKFRNTAQLEFTKSLESSGRFSGISLSGIFRGTYDAVYDLNDDEFGDQSGRRVSFPAPGNPAFLASQPPPPTAPPGPPFVSTQPGYAELFGPPPPAGGGALPLPAVNPLFGGTPIAPNHAPFGGNQGLKLVGEDVHNFENGGVVLAYPSRPCDTDSRGCIDDYLDFDADELKYPEFNDRYDFIRELFLDATMQFENGRELGFRVGRQQVVWGRTDLFRVLDVVNPVDFSRHNIFDELEDIRYPMGIVNAEYRFGATRAFDDLNVQLLWKFEKFRPHNLGQGGQPYAILGAGNFFRAMNTCWELGCTVWNFPTTGLAVDFPANTIGIRQANLPETLDEVGIRVEGLYRSVGFSLNALHYYSQLPSLHGGIPSDNPFTPGVESTFFPYSLAWDIEFPSVYLVGGSADLYSEKLKSAFRVELAYTSGEEFPNSIEERLFSESDVLRWVIGWDRPTFIPALNTNRAFLLSAQLFGQHLLDHQLARVNSIGIPTVAPIGIPDWENNYVFTLLIQGNYLNDRLTPQIISAYDFKAGAGAFAPSISWKRNNNWVITAGFNIKFGDGTHAFDDNRSANPYPPFSCAPPVAASAPAACQSSFSSLGVNGFEPLGRFRAGPFGNAINEDEFQISIRYQF